MNFSRINLVTKFQEILSIIVAPGNVTYIFSKSIFATRKYNKKREREARSANLEPQKLTQRYMRFGSFSIILKVRVQYGRRANEIAAAFVDMKASFTGLYIYNSICSHTRNQTRELTFPGYAFLF